VTHFLSIITFGGDETIVVRVANDKLIYAIGVNTLFFRQGCLSKMKLN